jgi:CHAT domain-containing protein/predicted negative regulator of RcsB-dependent stress response
VAASALLTLLAAAVVFAQSQARPESRSLPVGSPESMRVGGADPHIYEFELGAGELFQVHVEQKGANVLLRLLDGGGRKVAQMNSPYNLRSVETLTFVAPARGAYRLEISALDAKAAPGECTILREPSRTATEADRRRVEAERIFVEAMKARATDGQEQEAIRKFGESQAAWEQLGDAEMTDLSRRLVIKSKAYAAFIEARALVGKDGPGAIKKFEEAREFFHQVGETEHEGAAVLGMQQAAALMNDERASIEFMKQALPLFAKPEQKGERAAILTELGKYYLNTAKENDTALSYFLPLDSIYQEFSPSRDQVVITSTIGVLYHNLGDEEKAYEYLHKALLLRNYFGDKCSELETLINLGKVSLDLGLKAEALRHLKDEAPPLYKGEGGCAANRAAALTNLGKTYYDLGDYKRARDSYTAALKEVGDDDLKAILNNNLGTIYYGMGRYDDSLVYYLKALSLYKDDARARATTQTNVGDTYAALGRYDLAVRKLREALGLRQAAHDTDGEAVTLTSLSEVYLKSGDEAAAIKNSNRALTLFGAVNDPSGEAAAYAVAMDVSRAAGKRRLAIFYGKLSVNRLQGLRGAARGIEGELQINYLRTVKGAYRHLSELLAEEGLYDQAIHVLNLYQDQQFFDLNLDPKILVQRAQLSTVEEALSSRFEARGSELRSFALQLAELKRRGGEPPTAGGGDATKLQAEFDDAAEAFAATLREADSELGGRAGAEAENKPVEDVVDLRAALAKLGKVPGQKAASLYALAGDERFYVMLLTPGGVKAFSYPIGAVVLDKKVKDLQAVLGCPRLDPFRASAGLYDVIFKSVSPADGRTTLEAELEREKPELLLWSLGDALKGVPVAALYDEGRKQFLVERYQHTVFTRVRPDRVAREPKPWLEGIGLGTTRPFTHFSALPGVRQSLYEIFGDAASRHEGILKGQVLLDDGFKQSTLESLKGRWPLVHIASHFAYYPGNAEDSVLLLGDGSKFSLSKMLEHDDLFAGVEMLMLAACKTSVSEADEGYGKEVDGFAEVAQRLKANSVVATLWNIADASASVMEVEFYGLHRDHPDWSKSELLRQTQLAMLRGGIKPAAVAAIGPQPRGAQAEAAGCASAADAARRRFTPNPKAPLAHPYYWAPFVLYGSSR